MADIIRFKRGTYDKIKDYTPDQGEPIYDKTRKSLRMGNGNDPVHTLPEIKGILEDPADTDVLDAGVIGWNKTRNILKFGDGASNWVDLEQIKAVPEGFVNVKDFGAKGDGETDDTNAIQQALNTGKPVILPKGIYKISAPLSIKNSIIGLNVNDVIIKQTTADIDAILYFSIDTEQFPDIVIKNITIDGQNIGTDKNKNKAIFITLNISSDVDKNICIEKIKIKDIYGSAINIYGNGHYISNVIINNVKINNVNKHGVDAYFVKNIKIINSSISNVENNAIQAPDCEKILITNNTINNSGWNGIEIGDKSLIYIINGNIVYNSGNHAGILVEQSALKGIISNNIIIYPQYKGIQVNYNGSDSTGETIISNNYIYYNKDNPPSSMSHGIMIYGGTSKRPEFINITNNTIIGGLDGIYVDFGKFGKINSNIILYVKNAGIYSRFLQEFTINDNFIARAQKQGIYIEDYGSGFESKDLVIKGNTLLYNSQEEAGTYPGIYIVNAKDSFITDNLISKHHQYAIKTTGENASNIAIYNNATDNNYYNDIIGIGTSAISVPTKKGSTANRPQYPITGQMYFDTDINKPIWWNGSNWIDATGTSV